MKENTVFYNHGKDPIYISRKIKVSVDGLSSRSMESKILIMPGDGIDISILDLKPEKPKARGK